MKGLHVLAVAEAGNVGEVLAYAEGGRVLEVVGYAFNPNQPRLPKGDKHGGEWLDVYHGTAEEFLKGIKESGLIVQPDKRINSAAFYKGERGRSVYVTTDLNHATSYAITVARAVNERKPPEERGARLLYGELVDHSGNKVGLPAYTLKGAVVHFRLPKKEADKLKEDRHDINSFRATKIDAKYVAGYYPVVHDTEKGSEGTKRGRYRKLAEKDGEELVDLYVVTFFKEPVPASHSYAQVDYAQIGQDLDALEARTKKDLREVLSEWRDKLQAKITRAANGDGLNKLAADLRIPRRGDFTTAMQEALRRAWEKGSKDARAEVRAGRRAVREMAGTDSSFTPRAALRWLNEKAFWITSVTGDRLLNEVRGTILQSIKTGRPLGETILAVAAVFAPYIGDGDVIGDEKQTEPYRLETIIRTNTTDAYNHGRLTEFVKPELLPFLNGLRYSAILDERTTEVCRFLDGKVFKPGTSELEALLPPNHFNCRSIIVAVVVGEQVPAEDFITAEQVGRAKGLADAKFLTLQVSAWKAYREQAHA